MQIYHIQFKIPSFSLKNWKVQLHGAGVPMCHSSTEMRNSSHFYGHTFSSYSNLHPLSVTHSFFFIHLYSSFIHLVAYFIHLLACPTHTDIWFYDFSHTEVLKVHILYINSALNHFHRHSCIFSLEELRSWLLLYSLNGTYLPIQKYLGLTNSCIWFVIKHSTFNDFNSVVKLICALLRSFILKYRMVIYRWSFY